jgi:hypothetical protein
MIRWRPRTWYVVVCVAGLAAFAILFTITDESGPALLIGFGTGLILLLFARLQEPGTPDGCL